jgi:ribose 5-phosphate isomerase B
MHIAVGSDHAGWRLKQDIISLLQEMGHHWDDLGCFSPESCDYPDIARQVAEGVASGRFERGILICNTGIGMCITANKVPGIRAALCHDTYTARRAREHNDANILCLGEGVLEAELAKDMVRVFLSTPFAGDRHARRVQKLMGLDQLRQGSWRGLG